MAGSFDGALGWLNSEPLSLPELRGKVIVVQFWTYSCINWLRTESYVRAWEEKYKDYGVVVVGVHTPEFGFEKNTDNIGWAAKAYRVGYPIAIDSNFAVWRSFDNHYWPALYFIDAEGRIRHTQFGEGNYERSESVIQDLLHEAGKSGFAPGSVQVEGLGAEAQADWENLRTPETYVGYARADNFASSGQVATDAEETYAIPPVLLANHWALSGRWAIGRESATLKSANGKIAFRFHARDVHLVMGPASRANQVRFRVRIDGAAPGADAGGDIDRDGNGVLIEQRLYQLIRQDGPVADRTFEIEFLEPGAEAFVFTFG